jgi:hypothetical protein
MRYGHLNPSAAVAAIGVLPTPMTVILPVAFEPTQTSCPSGETLTASGVVGTFQLRVTFPVRRSSSETVLLPMLPV